MSFLNFHQSKISISYAHDEDDLIVPDDCPVKKVVISVK